MRNKISKKHEPGMIDTKNFSAVKTFFKSSGRLSSKKQYTPTSQPFVRTTPEIQPDEDDAGSLLDSASKDFAKPRKTRAKDAPSHPSAVGEAGPYEVGLRDSSLAPTLRNGMHQTPNPSAAGVLRGHDPTAASQHPGFNSHTTSTSTPNQKYHHQFLGDSQIFKTSEVDGDPITLPMPDGLGDPLDTAFELSCENTNNIIRTIVSEMPAVPDVPSPVEAPTSPVIQNRRQSRAETSASSRRPVPTSTTSRGNDAAARTSPTHVGLQMPPRINGQNGNTQTQTNIASTMAGQGAREAMNRTTVSSSGQTSGPDARSAPTLNTGQLDRRGHRNGRSSAETNEATGQKQLRPPLAIPQPSPKRESRDTKAAKLRNSGSMVLGLEESNFSDQERVNLFLQNHDVPLGACLDPLSTLLQWVSVKLEQVDHEDGELDHKASRLGLREREITELEAGSLSLQSEWESWAEMQQEHLENANETIARLGGDVQSERQRVQSLADSLEEALFQRDHANDIYQTLLRKMEEREEEDRNFYEAEIIRFTQGHAAQIMTLKEQMKRAQTRAESRIASIERSHQKEIEITAAEIKGATAAMSRIHKEEMEKIENELNGTIARHDTTMAELRKQHSDDLELEKRAFHDLRRQMASYSSTGDYTAISDKDFEKSFQLHTRSISNLIKWIPRPETYALDEHLDPNNFLARNAPQGGRNWPKFVHSVCWRFIVRGFFSRQLGFGAFGPGGEGFQELDYIHQLFAIPNPQDPNGPNAILPNTKELNTWRAKFFNALVQMIRNGSNGQVENKYTRLFYTNVDVVTDHLVSALEQVVNTSLDSTIREQVIGFVEGLGILALEMGSQRAHICLETCEYGEKIVAGDRFRNDAELGYEQLAVDLMTQPCLRRIGDGRENLTTERTIAHGDFVAMKPDLY
ncbi:hypothetical protein B0J13DRAFT_603758 [Dactylonectria estremocensis]|uniref:Uncharacterized protein n=1 Tax=Dactylonectria estremocensis TaxID=1079267 RepID=A0A9P9FCY3_9HYPO|nr:hypothetical protein B0J13DRAFT_603758 [Dactylonectria estremocensis]